MQSLDISKWEGWWHALILETKVSQFFNQKHKRRHALAFYKSVRPEKLRDIDSEYFTFTYGSEGSESKHALENIKIYDKCMLEFVWNYYDYGYDTDENGIWRPDWGSKYVAVCGSVRFENRINDPRAEYWSEKAKDWVRAKTENIDATEAANRNRNKIGHQKEEWKISDVSAKLN